MKKHFTLTIPELHWKSFEGSSSVHPIPRSSISFLLHCIPSVSPSLAFPLHPALPHAPKSSLPASSPLPPSPVSVDSSSPLPRVTRLLLFLQGGVYLPHCQDSRAHPEGHSGFSALRNLARVLRGHQRGGHAVGGGEDPLRGRGWWG